MASTPTVVFIDDSATMREVIKIAFRRENIEVVAYPDAASALPSIEQGNPDVVITDVIMPDKDGYEVCQYIKQHPNFSKTPVILMSGVVNKAVADKAFAVKAYLAWDKQEPADIERVYDHYAKVNTYERVPYVLAPAVQYILDHPADAQVGALMRAFNFRSVIDNSVVERLAKQGFFEQLFGPGIKAEEERKAKIAFR